MLPSSFLRLFVHHFSLTNFSINCLQLRLSFAALRHSPPTLSRYLFTLLRQSSHCIIDLHRLLFPPLSLHLTSLPILRFPFFTHDRPISTYISHQFLLLKSPPSSVCPFFSYPLSLLLRFFLSSYFSKNCPFCCFSVRTIVSLNHTCIPEKHTR